MKPLKKYSYVASGKFVKNWSRLDSQTQKSVVGKIDLFLENPYLPSLKTHKLSGKLNDFWSFSVSYSLRILFQFSKNSIVEFIDIGGHEIYK